MFWKNKEKQQKQQKQKTDQISINRLNIRSLLIRDLIKLLKIRSVKRLASPRIQDLNWNCIRRIIVSTTRRRRDIKIALCLSAPAEKFNVVSNDHGRTHKCDFSVSDRKYPFCANLVKKKNPNCQFKLKFGTFTNSNMQSSMALFIFFCFRPDTPFWANLVRKIRVVSLSWNLVPILIRIRTIQWRCSLFLV